MASVLTSLATPYLRIRGSSFQGIRRGGVRSTRAFPAVAPIEATYPVSPRKRAYTLVGSLTPTCITLLGSVVRTAIPDLIVNGPGRQLVLRTALSIPKAIPKWAHHPAITIRASSVQTLAAT